MSDDGRQWKGQPMNNLYEMLRRRKVLAADEKARGFPPHTCMGHGFPLHTCPCPEAHSPHVGKIVVHGEVPRYTCTCGGDWPCQGFEDERERLTRLFGDADG